MRNYGTDFSPINIGISQQNFKAASVHHSDRPEAGMPISQFRTHLELIQASAHQVITAFLSGGQARRW